MKITKDIALDIINSTVDRIESTIDRHTKEYGVSYAYMAGTYSAALDIIKRRVMAYEDSDIMAHIVDYAKTLTEESIIRYEYVYGQSMAYQTGAYEGAISIIRMKIEAI